MTFQVCLPISNLITADIASAKALLDDADVLEIRKPVLPAGLPDKTMIYHWSLGTVQEGFINAFDKENLGEFLSSHNIEMFSFDMGPACRKNDYVLPMSRTLKPEEIMEISYRSLEHVRGRYQGRLAVENYNYYPTGLYEYICRPDFMAEFLSRFDLGLVLDLAHAWISASNLGLDVKQYLMELPLDKVVEVHLTRPLFLDRLAVDAHLAPEDEDFELLGFLLRRLPNGSRPTPVEIEYYKDLEGLEAGYKRLGKLLDEINNERK